jgi:hypothetical protein
LSLSLSKAEESRDRGTGRGITEYKEAETEAEGHVRALKELESGRQEVGRCWVVEELCGMLRVREGL